MSPKKLASFRLDKDVLDALAALRDRDGVPHTETVARALRAWFDKKGIPVTTKATPTKGRRSR